MLTKVEDLKANMLDLIDNLYSRIKSITQLYYSGNNKEGNERIAFLIEDIETLINGLHVSNIVRLSTIEEFNEVLRKTLQELENQDYHFVADLLLYEIAPLLKHWEEQIKS